MAEEEKKERKVIEFNIWFIILLVVLIITTAWIVALNQKCTRLESNLATVQQDNARLSKVNSERAELIRDIVKDTTDGNISNKELIKRLNATIAEKDTIIDSLVNPVVDENSGEAE
jgi:predicted transcriptional regulator